MSESNESPRLTNTEEAKPRRRRGPILAIAVILTAIITFGITALAMNILNRQIEAEVPYARVVDVDETTLDPSVWGKNFPVQYEQFLRTAEMGPTAGHGGSVPVEQEPTDTDPRTIVSSSRLEEDPRLVTMWDGYAFSVDYRHARGHEFMLEDQTFTQRVTNERFNQPGTCMNCHASLPTVFSELGDGDREAGWNAMNAMSYEEAREHVTNPISCIDCHDPETMALRITRPAFVEGIADYMATQGIEDYDVNTDATAQEMRSFVCAQCHVEYYFDGDANNRLTFPWANGMLMEEILGYYLIDGHIDFTHPQAGTPIIKAQHPEFEIWMQGTHAQAGVTCADCHMPYQREGSHKVTNHHVQSPLLMINESCGTCHSASEEELESRVLTIQDRFMHSRDVAMDALVQFIAALETARTDGTPADQLELAQSYHQAAQFYIDYVYSENGFGFHADQYEMRILNDAQNFILQGQLALQGQDVGTVGEFLIAQGVNLEGPSADVEAAAAGEG
ncbi:MAG TPA: ammonia-forming cytochrome c nitrite reductase subunit c552 [Actinomycetaceae bacterium]|nr:ammonia-forming cytochrome c nitrite reductase subunit c552 [Actinomycetaceae bacterium]